MSLGSASQRRAIESALLDYHRAPGKYPLIRKQPPLLFASIKEVLQLASGRSPDGAQASGPAPAVRQAACFFIRTAMLYPDADHYALLGLDHDADAAAVKDRYRLMMRLMHPDFSSSRGASWPADAASRVNKAYEILSSPQQRSGYDERLDPPAPARPPAPTVRAAVVQAAARKAPPEDPRRRLKQLATVFGAAGAVALLTALFASGSADKENLVQRARTIALPAPIALLAAADPPPTPVISAAPAAAAMELTTDPRPTPGLQSAPPATQAMPQFTTALMAFKPAEQQPLQPFIAATPAPPAAAAVTPMPSPAATPAAPPVAAVPAPPQPQPQPPPAVPKAAPNPGVTLAEVHPLLSKLLQQMESGWGDRMLTMLDRDARTAPSAQAFLQHYNNLVDGARPVRLSDVHFRSDPREGRLLVTGHVLVHVRDEPPGAPGKDLSLQAEFASRDGTVVMTRLGRSLEQ